VRKARQRPRPEALRSRLDLLRERAGCVAAHARLGRDLRRILTEWGLPTWKPAEDLSYRRWIEVKGDEGARLLLAAIDEALEKRWAAIEEREAREREAGGGDAALP
jgi:hypothetical protein